MSDLSATPAGTDPKSQPSYRIMKAVVILLGILIVLALMGMIAGIVMRVTGHGRAGYPQGKVNTYALPPHSRILSLQVTANSRVVLTVATPRGNEVDIFDADSGRLVARIAPPK